MASHRSGDFGFVSVARIFDSEGYDRIRESERGSVDEPAWTSSQRAAGRGPARATSAPAPRTAGTGDRPSAPPDPPTQPAVRSHLR